MTRVSNVRIENNYYECHYGLRVYEAESDSIYVRKNKFIWGVGRGSSVSSYILYLIGVHRVNSLKFGFDIKDYLK